MRTGLSLRSLLGTLAGKEDLTRGPQPASSRGRDSLSDQPGPLFLTPLPAMTCPQLSPPGATGRVQAHPRPIPGGSLSAVTQACQGLHLEHSQNLSPNTQFPGGLSRRAQGGPGPVTAGWTPHAQTPQGRPGAHAVPGAEPGTVSRTPEGAPCPRVKGLVGHRGTLLHPTTRHRRHLHLHMSPGLTQMPWTVP